MRRYSRLLVRSLWLTVPLAALVVAPLRGAEVDKLLPDDTEVVVTVNARQILDSALVKKYGLEPIKDAIKNNQELSQTFESLGLDPLKDIDVLISASPSGVDPDKGLQIVHGKFDVKKFKDKGAEVAKDHADIVKITKAGSHTVYEVTLPNQPRPFYVGVVNNSTIVLSPVKDYVADAFDRASGQKRGTIKKEVGNLIAKADTNQSLWVVALGSGLAKGPLASEQQAKMLIGKIDTVTGGVKVSEDVKLDFLIHAKNAQDAKDLSEKLEQGIMQAKGVLGFLAAQNKQAGAVLSMVETMKVKPEGKEVSIKAEATKDVIEKALNK